MRSVAPPLACLWVLLGVSSTALASDSTAKVRIDRAWARATPPGVQVGAAYAVISNRGEADRLIAVESTVSERVEIHGTSQSDGRMQMRPIASLEVPASGRVAFEPSGSHLMLVNLKQPLREGTPLSMTFVFEKSGRVSVQVPVAPMGSTQAPASNHDHHH
jgi:periplasmic copper chaperone A